VSRHQVRKQVTAHRDRHPGDRAVVLDRDRHAGERARIASLDRVSRRQRRIVRDMGECPDLRLQLVDPPQRSLHELARAQLSGSDQRREL